MENVKEFIIDYIQREYDIPDDVDILNLNYEIGRASCRERV